MMVALERHVIFLPREVRSFLSLIFDTQECCSVVSNAVTCGGSYSTITRRFSSRLQTGLAHDSLPSSAANQTRAVCIRGLFIYLLQVLKYLL